MQEFLNQATRDQMFAVILLDCIRKCNEMKVDETEYNRQLRAMLKNRTQPQQELAV
jgi:hypothetical protein